jgi:hypothetical protein
VEDSKNMQRALTLQQAMDEQLDRLVQQANQTVLLLEGSNLKENQIRNVVNVAAQGASVEALLNFIRYQIAREKAWRSRGKQSQAPHDFGHQVIADIQGGVRAAAQAVAATVRERVGDPPTEEDTDKTFNEAYCRLAEHYLGYLNRAFYYCTKADNGFQKLGELQEERSHARTT